MEQNFSSWKEIEKKKKGILIYNKKERNEEIEKNKG
jgi:hypothetical protein